MTFTQITTYIDNLLGTNSTEFSAANKALYCNLAQHEVAALIMSSDGKWEFDDSNHTDLPIATSSLVANQQDYSISGAGFLKILKVEIKNSAGNWQMLRQIDIQEKRNIAIGNYRTTAGTPKEYDLYANSIFLYPKPSYASSGGIKIYYQRVMDEFESTDTTKEPGFAELFHELVPLKAALKYAISKQMMGKIGLVREEIALKEQALVNHYSTRNKADKVSMSLRKESYGVDEDYQGEEAVNWS